MSEHYWTPQSNVSNETSTAKTFQRTISAQDTLAYATALLNEKEQSGSSNGSDGSPANENSDRSLRQGLEMEQAEVAKGPVRALALQADLSEM
ncbi:ubiquitin carboxyl-terminal hydrolase 24-like protein [Labeo rohita]|uniref:Ubiquitin carboxyl-terminal hydrolase 24-like protein n=1 Tax=Labeo rohita TaxID=84645 RepID=A0A498LBH7_LABRO|nr:ubiquitin carboxyl-terminal hydrolase 24-like protein [Labeo rohita]